MEHSEIFERMREEHRRVLEALDALEATMTPGKGGAVRNRPDESVRTFLDRVGPKFSAHMEAEDEALFPALREALPQTVANADQLRAEHATVRTMLAQLETTIQEPAGSERDEQLGVQMRDLVDLLRIHIRKEEALVISVAERVLRPREVEALAARMSQGERGTLAKNPRAGRSKGANS